MSFKFEIIINFNTLYTYQDHKDNSKHIMHMGHLFSKGDKQ